MTNSKLSSAHSNAYNFLSFVNSGVDPRTGTYSCNISLSNFLANALCGPSLPINLGFNALNSGHSGFGVGWSMQLSNYHRRTQKLNLSTGASHIAIVSNSGFTITDKKVRDLKTSLVGGEMHIEHKSGVLEVLSNPGLSWDEWLVSRIYSPEGRMIRLDYGVAAGRRYLREIHDESQRLLVVNPGSRTSALPEITLWPDHPDHKLVFRLHLQNNELIKISVLDNVVQASWRFTYGTVGGLRLITRLELPTDGIEQVSYRASALKLPSGAPLDALPAVSSHTTFPRANQPAITRDFTYSANNYLGNGSGARWRNGGDNLYQATGNYEYVVTEALVTGSGSNKKTLRRIRRVYNRFHLQVEETVNQNGKTVSSRTVYHEKPGLRFDTQPDNFQLPARVQVSYYDTSAPHIVRQEVTLTEYDEYGNLLKKTAPNGTTEIFEYYPLGASDGCPADSFTGIRWLKQKTLLPAPDRAPAPTLITCYRYTELPSASPERGHFLAVAQESVFQNSQTQPLLITRREYQDDANSPFLGRVKRKTETVQGMDTVYDYAYELLDDTVCTHTTLTASDSNSSDKSTWQDRLTGMQIKSLEPLGVTVETAHDRLGRKTLESVAPGTPVQALRTHRYRLADRLDDPVQTESVGANGALTVTRLDGLNRTSAVEVQDVDAAGRPMRATYSTRYDALGQLIEETQTDWLDGEPRPLTTRHRYDDWGNRCASIGADGVLHHDRHDPIALTQTQGVDKEGHTVTRKNLFGKDDSVERFDRNGKSCGITRYTYDGLGRCVEKTDLAGHTTRFTYDFADRLLLSQLPDGTRIRKDYVQHSTEDLATHIWVNDYLVGERTYDGLMRVTSLTVGGRTETFTYDGAQQNPATHITASGKVISSTYDPALSNQMTERHVDGNSNLSARWHYHGRHGRLEQASTPANQQQREYFPSGRLKSSQLRDGSTRHDATHRYSLNGLPLRYVDTAGVEQVTRYDALCRIAEVEQGQIKASYRYDAQGRVSRIDTLDTQSGKSLGTQLAYDDFGREIRRLLTVDDSVPEELSQGFNDHDQLTRKTLKRGNEMLRDETYGYDSRGRLLHYRCEGRHLPVDTCAKRVLEQRYVFDELDNIRQLTTRFEGGENIATYHYEYPDKTQLSRVSHSHPDYAPLQATFSYDRDGNQLNDERGRTLIYDDMGRLAAVAQEQP